MTNLPIGTTTKISIKLTYKEYLRIVKGHYNKEKGYRIKKGKFYYYILVPMVDDVLNIVSMDVIVATPDYHNRIYYISSTLKHFLEKVTGNFFQYEKYGEGEA